MRLVVAMVTPKVVAVTAVMAAYSCCDTTLTTAACSREAATAA
jgi:hypothetical protein